MRVDRRSLSPRVCIANSFVQLSSRSFEADQYCSRLAADGGKLERISVWALPAAAAAR
jgi:hypothetical protein